MNHKKILLISFIISIVVFIQIRQDYLWDADYKRIIGFGFLRPPLGLSRDFSRLHLNDNESIIDGEIKRVFVDSFPKGQREVYNYFVRVYSGNKIHPLINMDEFIFDKAKAMIDGLKLRPGEKMLEIGGGVTLLGFIAALKGLQVIEIERDQNMVTYLENISEKLQPYIDKAGGKFSVKLGDFTLSDTLIKLKSITPDKGFHHIVAADVIIDPDSVNLDPSDKLSTTYDKEKVTIFLNNMMQLKHPTEGSIYLTAIYPIFSKFSKTLRSLLAEALTHYKIKVESLIPAPAPGSRGYPVGIILRLGEKEKKEDLTQTSQFSKHKTAAYLLFTFFQIHQFLANNGFHTTFSETLVDHNLILIGYVEPVYLIFYSLFPVCQYADQIIFYRQLITPIIMPLTVPATLSFSIDKSL